MVFNGEDMQPRGRGFESLSYYTKWEISLEKLQLK